MAEPIPFKLEDIKRAGVENVLQADIIEIELCSLKPRHYSITGTAKLSLSDGREQKIFFKRHAPGPLQGDTFATRENLLNFHLKESGYLDNIYSMAAPPLVPRLLGRITDLSSSLYILFTECIDSPCARDSYFNLSQEMQKEKDAGSSALSGLEERKIQLLQQDLGQIARFNGICNAHVNSLPEHLTGSLDDMFEMQRQYLPKRVAHYLKRAVHYAEGGGKEGKKFKQKRAQQLIQRKGIDLEKRLFDIFEFRSKISYVKRLQHGDLRLDHNFGGVFCDLEDFGYYPSQQDIVTYTSHELATPPVNQLPLLLANYLILEKKYGAKHPPATEKLPATTKVDDLEQLVDAKIGVEYFANFLVGYLSGAIEDDIIVNGARKKYSNGFLKEMLREYPGYTPDKFQKSRMRHVMELYAFLTTSPEAGLLFNQCTNRGSAMAYFFNVGKLLNDLGLAEIDHLEVLDQLSKGSQYSLFFGNGEGKKRSGTPVNYRHLQNF